MPAHQRWEMLTTGLATGSLCYSAKKEINHTKITITRRDTTMSNGKNGLKTGNRFFFFSSDLNSTYFNPSSMLRFVGTMLTGVFV